MQLYGVSMVRDEADIIRANVLHHLSAGFDRLIVVDNGSSDGTDQELRRIGREDPRLLWRRDERPYRQAEVHTELMMEAYREGADWVVPIDADEFWYVPAGNLRDVLERYTAEALWVKRVDFIQRREQREPSPGALRHMTRRVPEPVVARAGETNRQLVESRRYAHIQLKKKPKSICRPSPAVRIVEGNHAVEGVRRPQEDTDEILCLHAPLRSRASLEQKARAGARREEAGYGDRPGISWHLRRWQRLQIEGKLEPEWAANSYADDRLDVYGVPHEVIFDPTLRDLLEPWLPAEPTVQKTGGHKR